MLSFTSVFGLFVTPEGSGNKAFQNITAKWKCFLSVAFVTDFCVFPVFCCCVCLCFCYRLLYLFKICCEIVHLWMDLFFVRTILNWLLFLKGLMSFSSFFGVLVTPEGSGNMVFQKIRAKWKIFVGLRFWCVFWVFRLFCSCFSLCCCSCWP